MNRGIVREDGMKFPGLGPMSSLLMNGFARRIRPLSLDALTAATDECRAQLAVFQARRGTLCEQPHDFLRAADLAHCLDDLMTALELATAYLGSAELKAISPVATANEQDLREFTVT